MPKWKTRHVAGFSDDWRIRMWPIPNWPIVKIDLTIGPITLLYFLVGFNTIQRLPKFSVGLLGFWFHYDNYKVPIEQ